MIQTGMQLTQYGINQADADMTLVGIQMVLDGTADVAGRIETVSALGTLNPTTTSVALPVFTLSSGVSTFADWGSTGIETIRYIRGNASYLSLSNRAGWSLINTFMPGRVSSSFQGREEAVQGLMRGAIKETQSVLQEKGN